MTEQTQYAERRIDIKANSKGNGITSALIGASALTIGFLLLVSLPKHLVLLAIGVIAIGIIASVIGFYKIKEPAYSLTIDKEGCDIIIDTALGLLVGTIYSVLINHVLPEVSNKLIYT